MMKCRKHPLDSSSAVGVCATCLRERLADLIAAQAQAEALGLVHARPCAAAEDRRKPDPQAPTHLAFPRSVSPYISRRKSDGVGGGGVHQRFYSTPQVGQAYKYSDAAGGFVASEPPRERKKRGKLSLLASLFGKFRSEKFDSESDPRFSSDSDPGFSRQHRNSCRATPSSSASSWLSFLSRRGKSRSRGVSAEDGVSAFDSRRPRRVSDRGMSPERGEESDDEDRENRSPLGSGYASESSHGGGRGRRRNTPSAGPPALRPRTGPHSRNVSGLSFCLSPLVRPSPARQWSHPKCGGFQTDAGYAGEMIRVVPARPHLSTAASYRGNNRSRKLADFGRVNPNR
ncbi:hypothetical protein BT93_E1354 [Corymbia citriodora subsp. variegata]|nr:hypothetical protein BT93_E1354 [Corymbia citriodora subsp. variegata]